MTYTVTLTTPLSGHAKAFAWMRTTFKIGASFGYWPEDRPAPTGEEHCIFAEHETNGIIGALIFCSCFSDEREKYWLDILYVDHAHRRKGVGKMLMEALMAAAPEGINELMLGTNKDNFPMQALAESCGYAVDHVVYQAVVRRG